MDKIIEERVERKLVKMVEFKPMNVNVHCDTEHLTSPHQTVNLSIDIRGKVSTKDSNASSLRLKRIY